MKVWKTRKNSLHGYNYSLNPFLFHSCHSSLETFFPLSMLFSSLCVFSKEETGKTAEEAPLFVEGMLRRESHHKELKIEPWFKKGNGKLWVDFKWLKLFNRKRGTSEIRRRDKILVQQCFKLNYVLLIDHFEKGISYGMWGLHGETFVCTLMSQFISHSFKFPKFPPNKEWMIQGQSCKRRK